MRLGRVIVLATIVALIGVACATSDERADGTDASDDPAVQAEETADSGQAADSVTVTTQGQGFSPPAVTVAAGGTVEFSNEDSVKHTMTAVDGSFDVVAEPGSTETIDLGGLDAGSYEFHCEFHPPMVGDLTIE